MRKICSVFQVGLLSADRGSFGDASPIVHRSTGRTLEAKENHDERSSRVEHADFVSQRRRSAGDDRSTSRRRIRFGFSREGRHRRTFGQSDETERRSTFRFDVLVQIRKRVEALANRHSCVSRLQLKILIEQSDGTRLDPFLAEFRRSPRRLSLLDLLDELLRSDLVSLSDLFVASRREIVVRKSSLIEHFDGISFLRPRDVDRLAQSTLVIGEDELLALLDRRADTMRQFYIKTILVDERRKRFLDETENVTSLTIHGESRRDAERRRKTF